MIECPTGLDLIKGKGDLGDGPHLWYFLQLYRHFRRCKETKVENYWLNGKSERLV